MTLQRRLLLGAAAAALVGASCAIPRSDADGSAHYSGGPAELTLEQAATVVAPGGRAVLHAKVTDEDGDPVRGARVEWLLSEGSVGTILDIDEEGGIGDDAERESSSYAYTETDSDGTTWISVTSPMVGASHVVAYCPDVADWDRQTAFTSVNWEDVAITVSEGGAARTGSSQPVSVHVVRASDGRPLEGYQVSFEIVSGPAATLGKSGKTSLATETDAQGWAKTTVVQKAPAKGENVVLTRVVKPADEECCKPPVLLGEWKTPLRWVSPAIGIAKSAPATAVVGETFRYDIVVQAGGDTASRGVTVTDTLPKGLAYVSSAPAAKVSGRSLSWSLGDMAAGTRKTITVDVRAERTGKFHNCAQVAAEKGSLKAEDCADTVVTAPNLALKKTATPKVLKCEPIEYTFTVTNSGDAVAKDVRIVDQLPKGLRTKDGKDSLSFRVAELGPGQSRTFRATVEADRKGRFENTATATAAGGLKAQAKAQTVVVEPALKVVKTGPDRRFIGRPITWDITVTNTGDGEARDTVLVDDLPAGVEFRSATGGGQASGRTVTWSLGTLAPGASRKVSVTAMPTAAGRLRNVATAQAFCAGAVADTHETSVEGIPAILLEVVDLDDPVEVGGNIRYTITVTNQGSADANDIVITAMLPAEVQYVAGNGPTQASAAGQTVRFAPLARLAPKAKATYQVTVKAVKAKDIRFKVSMVSAQSKEPVEETESTYIYE